MTFVNLVRAKLQPVGIPGDQKDTQASQARFEILEAAKRAEPHVWRLE